MPEWLKPLLPSNKFLLRLAVMSLPVAYILKKHLDWKPKPDSKKRMLIHHAVFWLSCIPALKFLHKTPGQFAASRKFIQLDKHISAFDAAKWPAAAVTTLIGGFEGGERLAKWLVPKQPKPPMQASSSITPIYTPARPNPYPTYSTYQNPASLYPTMPRTGLPLFR
ncbi:MAG: hypothetical protein K0Q50_883 [Vampirovibrio sp.]|jgi:hypothetical protein|nr:hypothetical protein [Vampirovibrio sp.]